MVAGDHPTKHWESQMRQQPFTSRVVYCVWRGIRIPTFIAIVAASLLMGCAGNALATAAGTYGARFTRRAVTTFVADTSSTPAPATDTGGGLN